MDMDMDTRSVDYGDFEYQHLDYEHVELGVADSERGIVTASVEPLEGVGGLDTHEVAELVAQDVTLYVEPDNFEGLDVDTSTGNIEFRGVFGSDLGSTSDLVSDQAAAGQNTLVSGDQSSQLFSGDGSDAELIVRGHDKEEVFDTFAAITTIGFEDGTNSLGGGGSSVARRYHKNHRELYGAGPVVDSSDEISVVSQLTKNSVDLTGVSAHYRTSCVWDVSTVEDAGRRFSVPE